MLKQYEELAVLEQGDDGAIVSIRGQGGPSVLLGATYLGHLERIVSKAGNGLTGNNQQALRLLCMEVKTLLATYQETCNKYEGDKPLSMRLATILEELDEMRKALDAS